MGLCMETGGTSTVEGPTTKGRCVTTLLREKERLSTITKSIFILGNGWTTSRTALARKGGETSLATKDNFLTDPSTEKENTNTRTIANLRVFSVMIFFTERESWFYLLENTRDRFSRGKWMGGGLSNGKMEPSMRVTTRIIKSRGWASTYPLKVSLTKAIGWTVVDRAKESWLLIWGSR